MSARGRVVPLVGLFASLVLVWSATAGVLWNANTPDNVAQSRFASADRLVFFRVDTGKTLRMQLPAGVEALRISTHLILPNGTTYSPERQYLYGLQLRVRDADGQVVLERPLFTRSRQSKAELVEGHWLKESAFSTQAGLQLTDERELALEVPPEVRSIHGSLELTYPGPSGAIALRSYARVENSARLFVQRERTRLVRAEARAGKATFVPWEKLSDDEQKKLADRRWQRLDALGEPGQDFQTEAIYHTDFRLPLVEVARAEEEALPARRGAAVNVNGPARIVAWLWRARPDADGRVEARAKLSAISVLGEATAAIEVDISATQPTRHELEIPAGAHSLLLQNDGDLDLRYTLEGPRFAWIAPDAMKGAHSTAQQALVPDVRRTEAWVTGGACQAVELEVGDALDDTARLIRIDARSLGFDSTPRRSTLTVTFVDAQGRQVGEAGFETPVDDAPFDAADLPLSESGRVPCEDTQAAVPEKTVEITDVLAHVSSASTSRVFVPKSARKMIVRASVPTAVNLYGFVLQQRPSQLARPYADFPGHGMRWRNAPVEGQSWRSLRPINHRALGEQGAKVAIVGQVRLEPSGPLALSSVVAETMTLKPLGAPASRDLLEQDGSVGEGGAPRSLFSRLTPNQSRLLRFDARTATRPELRLELTDPAALGQVVQVLVDGEPVRRFKLRTTHVRELLPPVKPGTHDILLKAASDDLVALLNRAPAGKDPGLRLRTAYRVGDGLSVRVPKKGSGPVNLNVVLYTDSPDASELPELNITIDGGEPRRNFGVLVPRLTRAQRSVTLPPSAHEPGFPVGDAGQRWYPHTVSVRLGEDLAPGNHEVHLTPTRNKNMWARFFIYAQSTELAAPRQWNRMGWDEEDAP